MLPAIAEHPAYNIRYLSPTDRNRMVKIAGYPANWNRISGTSVISNENTKPR